MKKYRTEWTIEESQAFISGGPVGVVWYRGTIDMDNQHYCATEEDAEREIDDAIILEQEQIIEKLRDALLYSTACMTAADSTLRLLNVNTVITQQIEENNQILKHIGL